MPGPLVTLFELYVVEGKNGIHKIMLIFEKEKHGSRNRSFKKSQEAGLVSECVSMFLVTAWFVLNYILTQSLNLQSVNLLTMQLLAVNWQSMSKRSSFSCILLVAFPIFNAVCQVALFLPRVLDWDITLACKWRLVPGFLILAT